MPDGQVKCYGRVATVDSIETLGVVTGGGIDAVVPGEHLAGGVSYECCGVTPNGEVESNG